MTSPLCHCPGSWPTEDLRTAAHKVTECHHFEIAVIKDNDDFKAWRRSYDPDLVPGDTHPRVLILWWRAPFVPSAIISWRAGYRSRNMPVRLRFAMCPPGEVHDEFDWYAWLEEQAGPFKARRVEKAPGGFDFGSFVKRDHQPAYGGDTRGYASEVLAVHPTGPLAALVDKLDAALLRCRSLLPPGFDETARKGFMEELEASLHRDTKATALHKQIEDVRDYLSKVKFNNVDRASLPRILLLGESGTGKTVAARYMTHAQPKNIRRVFKRVLIPAYLGREDHFEYDAFGYCGGTYTGAREEGSPGVIAEHIGGVLFFDEIGDANPMIQSKLLAYLDDYMVAPRGWNGRGYYCPTVVVAATNKKLPADGKWHEGGTTEGIRNDLLMRFNVVIKMPSLEERKDNLPTLIDMVMQMSQSESEKRPIKSIDGAAVEYLTGVEYHHRNFRLLENYLSSAADRARADGRDFIALCDLVGGEER